MKKSVASSDQLRDQRFQLRATVADHTLIRLAAERQGLSVTDFILLGAREKAEQILMDQTRFVIEEKQWAAFMEALDRPVTDKPRLRKLFREAHVAKRS